MTPREASQIADRVFDAKKYRIRTHVIAQVVSYDAATNTVTVQPVTKVKRITDAENITTIELPQISNVPVLQVGSGKLWCTVAPAVDTYGLLHISDRVIGNWLAAGGIVDPSSIRCHDLSDAIFEPSLVHLVDEGDNGKFTATIETDRISLRTRTGKTEISVVDDETVEIVVNESFSATVDTSGNASVVADGDVDIGAAGNVTVDCDGAASVAAGGDITLAKDSGESLKVGSASVDAGSGTDYVALATAVDTLWTTLYTLLTTWVPTPADGGAAFKAASIAAFPAPPSSVASGNLKAD